MNQELDYAAPFQFAFRDKQWISKLALAGLFFFLGLLLLILPGVFYATGYAITTAENVSRRNPEPLPDPSAFGEIISKGFRFFLANLLYTAPILIISLIQIPISIMISMQAFDGGEFPMQLSFINNFLSLISTPLNLLIGFWSQAVVVQFIRTGGDIQACWRVGEIFEMLKAHFSKFLLAYLVSIGLGIAFSIVLGISIITICGPILLFFPGAMWSRAAIGQLWGQLILMIETPKADAAPLAPT